MNNHEDYNKLTPQEETIFIGRLIIAVQKSIKCFEFAKTLIRCADTIGVYEVADVSSGDIQTELSDLDNPIENFK
jgi:hypothetical protein